MASELKPCPFCNNHLYVSRQCETKGCWMHEAKIKDPLRGDAQDSAFNTRAVPDVPELVRYKPEYEYDFRSIITTSMQPNIEGDYVRYDQVAGMLAAKDATLNGLLNALKNHTGDSHGLMAIRKLVERAEAAEAKLAEYEKKEPIGVIHQGVFYSTKGLEEYPEYSTGIKIYASPAPMEEKK